MVYRYSWIAALSGLALALYGLTRLLLPTAQGAPWQLIVGAGLILGLMITGTGLAYRVSAPVVALLNGAAFVIAGTRIVAPDTAWALLPTGATWTAAVNELDFAATIIRNGVSPVQPVAGVVLILTAVMWAAGAVVVWGLMRNHPYVGVIPPLVLVLQFITMDRIPIGITFVGLFIVIAAGSFVAVASDERRGFTARLRPPGEWLRRYRLMPAASLSIVSILVVTSVAFTAAADDVVPRDGALTWRSSSGLTGSYYGSVSFNPFTSIRKGLVSQNNIPVFGVRFGDDVTEEEAESYKFRMLTLETFNGEQFFANEPRVAVPDPGDPWEDQDAAFLGETETLVQDIVIDRLSMEWLPAVYAPVGAGAADEQVERAFRYRDDGSLNLQGSPSFQGMRYTVVSNIPQIDLGALAATTNGEPSAVFAAARDDGEEIPEPSGTAVIREEPPGVDQYLDLPTTLNAGVEVLSSEVTANLTTDFERALALEAFFRDSDLFTYSTDVPEGHDSADIAEWLLESFKDENPNHRIGYCEQFATSMAIMARTVGIPSRVVLGFSPGEVNRDGWLVVTDSDAHAWVELWMPQQGWVEFDPTPRSQRDNAPLIDSIDFDVTRYLDLPSAATPSRPNLPLPIPEFGSNDDPQFIGGSGGDESTNSGFSLPGWLPTVLTVASALIVLGGLIPAIKWSARRRRMARLRRGDISAAWEDIVARLDDFKVAPPPSATPREFAREIVGLEPLAEVYSDALYGPQEAGSTSGVEVATRSLETTRARLKTRYSPFKRFVAEYRVRSILPRWLRRRRR